MAKGKKTILIGLSAILTAIACTAISSIPIVGTPILSLITICFIFGGIYNILKNSLK